MSHPLSVYLKASKRRGKKVRVDTVWLVCEWQGGKWYPRQDLPPAFDEEIARSHAEQLTELSGRRHSAEPFRSSGPPLPRPAA